MTTINKVGSNIPIVIMDGPGAGAPAQGFATSFNRVIDRIGGIESSLSFTEIATQSVSASVVPVEPVAVSTVTIGASAAVAAPETVSAEAVGVAIQQEANAI